MKSKAINLNVGTVVGSGEKFEGAKNLAEKIVQEWELREKGKFDLAFKVRPTCFSDGIHHDEVLVAKAFLELLQNSLK